MNKRFFEIDFLRGIAIVFMVLFNYTFAFKFLKIYAIAESSSFFYWKIFPAIIAFVFIFLAGISLYISSVKKGRNATIMHGLRIFLLGIGITIVTFLFYPEWAVLFGILHLIGLGIILATFLVSFSWNFILGVIVIFFGIILQQFTFNFPWLLWLGFIPKHFTTFDYFPMLPWFGIVLLGVEIGKKLYENGKRNFKITDFSKNLVVKFLCFAGRNSLFIYLIHQPLLVVVLYFIGFHIF